MRSPAKIVSLIVLTLISYTSALNYIQSESLESCQANSGFTASLFDVIFTSNNNTLTYSVIAISTLVGNVTAQISVAAYGYPIVDVTLDPCDAELEGLCPIASGNIDLESNLEIPPDAVSQIPGIAYAVPDLDGIVTVKIFSKDTGAQVACVRAQLSNGKTVYQKGVGWATAVIAGLALLVSAITSGLGHSNTAAHIAANAMSLFGFFQAQALIGMTAVELPPIVSAWTQNFQWSMGIIRIGFIQSICTWYQQATGGTPSIVLSSLSVTSVSVQKRSLEAAKALARRALQYTPYDDLMRRGTSLLARQTTTAASDVGTIVVVRGIQRVGFNAVIELTNIFLTGYIFFIIFIGAVVLGVVLFRWILEALAKSGKMKSDKFLDFRNGWTTILRGILFRMVLIGFPQMVVLCFWEMTRQDSAGEAALAVITVFTMIIMLFWACSKVWLLARRSIAMHKNPAYILYSDPVALHKWGFLYVQFKATAYWFIIPLLVFILLKGMFVAFGQGSGITQAIAFVVLEASLLVGVVILRPYMDKKTNAFNISISVVNLFSAIFLLFFTDVFGLPGLVVGVMGLAFVLMNAVFALVLLILMLIAITYAIFSKDPDVRYQPMRDDRGSFIKSQTQLTTELDALGATARGETKVPFKPRDVDEDSYSGSSWEGQTKGNGDLGSYQALAEPYNREMTGPQRFNTDTSYNSSPYARENSVRSNRGQLEVNQPPSRSQTTSPWQRGAGYDR